MLTLCCWTVFSQTITPGGPLAFCDGGNVTLTASAGDSYQWQLNNSNIGGATSRTYLATASGSYTVIITTGGTPATSPAVSVTENSKPVPDFTNPTGTVCAGAQAQFTSTVTDGKAPYKYNWAFGDGGNAAIAHPLYRFTARGCGNLTINNTLTVTDDNGCTGTISKNVVVQRQPEVELSDANNNYPAFNNCANNPDPAHPDFTIRVGNISPNAGCITSYTLNWGDGTPLVTGLTAASFPLSHTYNRIGAFPMVITGIGSNGCSASKSYTVANQSNPDIGIATVGATEGCAPLPITVLITNWQLNSPGTSYRLQFGDGGSMNFSHPINGGNTDESVSHTYNITSCPNSQDWPVSITATNACRSKTFTGGNIVVRTKPNARFRVTNTACAGQNTCFEDASEGYLNNCNTAGTFLWNFGEPSSGANNTSTSPNPCHVYATAGTYTVTITKTNPCGTSTNSYPVCVNPPSTAQFNFTNNKVCVGSTVVANNSSGAGNCSNIRYDWDVYYSPGFCGTFSSWQFVNGTHYNSVSPAFQFNTPGYYTVTMRLSGACGNGTVTKVVEVKQRSTVTIAPFTNACGAASVNPRITSTVNCGADPLRYLWEFDNGTVGTSTNANPGTIVFSNPGTHTVKLTITNECGSYSVSEQFVTWPLSVLTLPAPPRLCGGTSTAALNFNATLPGTSIRWTNNNPSIGLPVSGIGNIPSFTAINNSGTQVTATITVTATTVNNCNTVSTFNIIVDPRPPTPATANAVSYCQNATATALTATASSGHTLRWYTTPTSGTANSNPPTPVTTTPGVTNYYVSQVNTNTNCEGDRILITVTITANFSITSTVVDNPTHCATATGFINLRGLAASATYVVRYTKDGGTPISVTISSDAMGLVRLGNLSAGTYSNISVSTGGCSSNAAGPFTLKDPNPPPAPAPGTNPVLCEGTPLVLEATSTTSGVTYQWTGPLGFTSTLQNPIISNAIPANSGVYAVRAVLNNCSSTPVQLTALVHPRPLAPTVNPTTATCLNQALLLNAATNFAGTVTWSWRGPNGFSSADQNPIIASATNSHAGVYAVRITSTAGNCASPEAFITATIKPVPVIAGGSFVNPVGCSSSNGIIVLTGLQPFTQYTINFYRNGVLQAPVNLLSAPDGNVLVTGLPAGLYTDITANFGGCASNKMGPFTLDDTPPFSLILESSNSICDGSDLFFKVRATAPGAALYSWTGPNGFSSTEQNPSIRNAVPANSGVYEAAVTINGCTAKNRVTVTVSLPSIGGQTAGAANVCPGQNNGAVDLSGHRGNVIRWESSINNGLRWEPITLTAPVLHYTDVSTKTWYRAIVQNGACPPAASTHTEISVRKGIRSVDMRPGIVTTCNHDTTISFSSAVINEGTGNLKYYWYVNGQVVGNSDKLSHRFQSPLKNPAAENFKVWVVAENTDGCQKISSESKVVIHALPIPAIEVSPTNIQREPKYAFTFTDKSVEEPGDAYTWNVGDPSSPLKTGRQITYDYKRTGTFKVNLYVFNRNTGCDARDSVRVTIVPVPGSLVIPNAFYPNSAHPELRNFKIKGIGMLKYRLQVYDSWGKVVFETTELNADGSPKVAWNGRYMNTGRTLPQDAYTWKVVEIVFENGKPWNGMSHNGGAAKHFGNVTLFR